MNHKPFSATAQALYEAPPPLAPIDRATPEDFAFAQLALDVIEIGLEFPFPNDPTISQQHRDANEVRAWLRAYQRRARPPVVPMSITAASEAARPRGARREHRTASTTASSSGAGDGDDGPPAPAPRPIAQSGAITTSRLPMPERARRGGRRDAGLSTDALLASPDVDATDYLEGPAQLRLNGGAS